MSTCSAANTLAEPVVCAGCGARYSRLPGFSCPRCGTAFPLCAGCQGCGGGPAEPRQPLWRRLVRRGAPEESPTPHSP